MIEMKNLLISLYFKLVRNYLYYTFVQIHVDAENSSYLMSVFYPIVYANSKLKKNVTFWNNNVKKDKKYLMST